MQEAPILTHVLLGLLAFLAPGITDPRLGSWKLVSAQSAEDPPNRLAITSSPDSVHVVMSGETHMDFSAKPDGHDGSVPGNPAFDQVELHRMNKKQVEVIEKKGGAVVGKLLDKLSPDGNELAITTTTPGHTDQVTVWTRTGGLKAAKDPFAGEWTENLGKTRLRQGLVLKVEANGTDGVRFSGEYSYTARFDGQPYDLRNSRNDTVQLALVDAHTVDAAYRRDNQVTQKDRWVVSADGRSMTVDTTATLETGQHVTEKLMFLKQ